MWFQIWIDIILPFVILLIGGWCVGLGLIWAWRPIAVILFVSGLLLCLSFFITTLIRFTWTYEPQGYKLERR